MKHKVIYSLIALIVSLSSVSQNWDVFNKSYRYNYVYDNNTLVTNVLFVDSIRQAGNDTIYNMNRIGIECVGSCPTLTTAISSTDTVIVYNIPQFLQRKIIKYATGLVMFSDTAKLVLKPNCSLNEVWLFDSINTKMAQCIDISTQSIFAMTDSVKTILIDGTDTLKLSKQFGIIQFPNVYNKNKYYRLVGIENKASYSQNALFGIKVPNAWDMYDFDIGDKFYYTTLSSSQSGAGNGYNSTSVKSQEILSKLSSISGYTYTIQLFEQSSVWSMVGQSVTTYSPLTNTITTLSYTPALTTGIENMYPGQMIQSPDPNQMLGTRAHNIVKFGLDDRGKFYKFCSNNCSSYSNVVLSNINEGRSFIYQGDYYSPGAVFKSAYGVNLGCVTDIDHWNWNRSENCLTGVRKNGSTYLGNESFLGITNANWNVFNKNYRYNYTYDNNALVTNVLFADSITQTGNDTIYHMNRIGIECAGTCPTLTTAITGTSRVIVPNVPQFLQRNIVKYTNGLVMLMDTAKLIIKSNCILGESWLFDSINNKTAKCILISTQPVLTVLDSVRTILINGTDTMKLSNQFGIIQFPILYNKNKYYRLVGIENANSFDQTALYGTKVSNAWDFYNFDVGDKFCYNLSSDTAIGTSNFASNNTIETIEVINKSTTSFGYSYLMLLNSHSNIFNSQSGNSTSTTNTTTTRNYSTTVTSDIENMYPGQIIKGNPNQLQDSIAYNIVKFGLDNHGKFYKFFSNNCTTYTNSILPNENENDSYVIYAGGYYGPLKKFKSAFGENLGQITNVEQSSGWTRHKCLTCALKNGSLYLDGAFVGIEENSNLAQNINVHPNPTSGEVTITNKENTITKIEVGNYLGQIILTQDVNESNIKLHLQEYTSGIYFLKVYNKEGQVSVRKIIKN